MILFETPLSLFSQGPLLTTQGLTTVDLRSRMALSGGGGVR